MLIGVSFHFSASCKSSKESQNDAAKMAFLPFTSPPPPSNELNTDSLTHDCAVVRLVNFLDYTELAQREDLSMPVYKIIKYGALQIPTFFSNVEIEGEEFYGKSAEFPFKKLRVKSPKLHKMKLSTLLYFTTGLDMTTAVNLQQHLKQNGQLSSPVIVDEEHSAETEDKIPLKLGAVQELNFSDRKSGNAKVGPEDSILSLSPEKPAIAEVIGKPSVKDDL
ncbi:hypothetical protein SADUNF_Sadunf09G0124200 [Salix dunnii]|uniref:Uncharacterized protein n=1 Tax=Salix dunnii TaxID=1413687 RepID=A0A835MRK4_9ROSI|nr:hypothetical protein SADUNF_Sadunf09G0124200 [Salix dunnii]